MASSKKFRDAARDGRVAFVVDDVLPPWKARGIEIRGRAETLPTGGHDLMADFDPELIRLTPSLRSTSFFAPPNAGELNQYDTDLSSTSPLLLPGGRVFMTWQWKSIIGGPA